MRNLSNNAGRLFAALAIFLGSSHAGKAQTEVKPGNMSSVRQHAPPSAGEYQPSITRGNSNEYHAPPPERGYAPSHPRVQEYARRTEQDLTAPQINRGIAAHSRTRSPSARARAKRFPRSGARRPR